MFKLLRLAILAAMLYGAFSLGGILHDRQTLNEDIIRLHVVANSNDPSDQQQKIKVKDAVVEYLEQCMGQFSSAQEAKQYLQTQLEEIRLIAQKVIEQTGSDATVSVSLQEETFDTRDYETFSLPAGVYDALRIVIGDGNGKNWWCVVFPRLCTPVTKEGFEDSAAGAGFSDSLTQTVSGEDTYEIRFWLLDCLGRIESFLFRR